MQVEYAAPDISLTQKDLAADGLRGIAAINVVLCHFLISIYPKSFESIYSGSATPEALRSRVDYLISNPILSIMWNGNFAVCIFFVLSGYVLTKVFVETGDINSMKLRAARRYLRLSIPIFGSVLLSYAALKIGLKNSDALAELSHSAWLAQFWNFPPSLPDALRQGSYSAIFTGQSSYNPILWTMRIEFIGSMLVFGFRALNLKGIPGIINFIITSFALMMLFPNEWMLYLGFIAGSYLADVKPRSNRFLTISSLIIAIIGGAYNSSQWYAFARCLDLSEGVSKNLFNTVGAIALFYVVRTGLFNLILNHPVIQYLGKISYAIYLVHLPILLSLTSWLFMVLIKNYNLSYGTTAITVLIATMATIILIATIFHATFDKFGIYLSKSVFPSESATKIKAMRHVQHGYAKQSIDS